MLVSISSNPQYKGRKVVMILDNARIHHHQFVLQATRRHSVNVCFLSPYSPWLNPVESLFGILKRRLSPSELATR